MPKPEVLLYDDVHRWSFGKPGDAFTGTTLGGNSKEGEKIMRDYRVKLRQATRFYIGDDFLNLALDMSRDMEQIKKWVNLARLPYDHVWIEFDCREKVKNSERAGKLNLAPSLETVPQRMGWLLQTINQDTGAWAMTLFSALDEASPRVHPMSYFLAPEGPSLDVMRPPPPWDVDGKGPWGGAPNLSDLEGIAHMAVAEDALAFASLTGAARDGQTIKLGMVPEFVNRIQMTQEPLWMAQFRDSAKRVHSPENYNRLYETMRQSASNALMEESGVVRVAISILAMMNAAPNVKHYYAPAVGHRMKRGKFVPYMDHNEIVLSLPKTKPIPILIRALDKASAERRKNRAHMVRGHFRVVQHGKMALRCKHEPTLIENGEGYCLRCEQKIKWVAAHQRGDASVGWVNHDYLVEAS